MTDYELDGELRGEARQAELDWQHEQSVQESIAEPFQTSRERFLAGEVIKLRGELKRLADAFASHFPAPF